MSNFKSFGLPPALVQTLEHLNITVPTPVQEKAIPAALAGSDVLATAQTGTGKTLAYLLPIVTKMQDNAHEQALVLAPTRELAEQIKNALVSLLGRKGQHDVVLLIGGASLFKQFIALKKRPRFIIGTPGRIIDHLERGKLTLHDVRFLVLDEMDRMLDMGFTEALETILRDVPKERQTLMFSATLPPNIAKMSQKYLNKPQHITIGSTTKAALQIKQEMIKTTAGDRYRHLLKELNSREGSVIIFVKTKISADLLAEKLQKEEHHAEAIHGDLRQRQRDAVIRAFRKGSYRIMVATDVAARGLDIPHIKHVINYDLPQCAEDYIHRIGRTGRAGLEGFALSFVLPNEGGKWKAIHRLLNSDPSTAYVGDNQGGGDWGHGSGGRGRHSARGQGRGAPRSSEGGRNRGERGAAPRSSGGYRDRSERSSAPRSSEGYRGRTERAAAPRSEGYRDRSERSSAPRSTEGYRGRTERASAPRSTEGYQGRGERSSAPRSSEGYQGRSERSSAPRSSEGYQGRSERAAAPRSSEGRRDHRSERSSAPRSTEGRRDRSERAPAPRSTEGRRDRSERAPVSRASAPKMRVAKSPQGGRAISVRKKSKKESSVEE